jgi:PTH1 family peptidyl-tRNA hydrolase
MKFLIVGLGNIGNEYQLTRHNIGFEVVHHLVETIGSSFKSDRYAYVAKATYKGKQLIVIQPTTYMNLSGKAVKYWMNTEKIPIENVLIVVDDLMLPLGTLRMRGKGSDAGHNGLKNIDLELQTNNYARLRFGIGNNFPKGKQIDFVLGKWSNIEIEILKEKIPLGTEMSLSFCTAGLANTMNLYNNK